MIHGIGTDIIAVARVQQSLQKFGDKFARRILSAQELQQYYVRRHPAHYLAKRFAAKEALVKAYGLGMREGLSFNGLSILNNSVGKPYVIYHAAPILELIEQYQITDTHISLSDEKNYAIAYVLLISGNKSI
jgi:holo-[acyl-carrier protein] synthase